MLSAILYLVFINDLLINLDNAKGGAMLLDLRVSSSVQADVIALLSPTVNGMQTLRDGPFNFRGGVWYDHLYETCWNYIR